MTAQIVPFVPPSTGTASSRPRSGPAEIIIFPGVRYQRAPVQADPGDRRPRTPTPGRPPEGKRSKG